VSYLTVLQLVQGAKLGRAVDLARLARLMAAGNAFEVSTLVLVEPRWGLAWVPESGMAFAVSEAGIVAR
jgi:hypothetical protein